MLTRGGVVFRILWQEQNRTKKKTKKKRYASYCSCLGGGLCLSDLSSGGGEGKKGRLSDACRRLGLLLLLLL